jgi:hypothetical protein
MSGSFIAELYRQTLDRERTVIWGPDAVCRLFTTTPAAGVAEVKSLTAGWVAHSISSIESAGPEEFVLEIDSALISIVKISADSSYDPATTQTFKIAQTGKPVKAGHIYQLRLISTGE